MVRRIGKNGKMARERGGAGAGRASRYRRCRRRRGSVRRRGVSVRASVLCCKYGDGGMQNRRRYHIEQCSREEEGMVEDGRRLRERRERRRTGATMEPRARRRLRRCASRCSSEEEAVYRRDDRSMSCVSEGGVNGAHHVDPSTPRSMDIWVCAAQRPTNPPGWLAPGDLASWGRVRGAVVVGGGQREGWGGRRGVVANLSHKAGVARGWRRPVAREGSGRCACPTRLFCSQLGSGR